MALVNQGGALRLVGGALGTGQACCCTPGGCCCVNGYVTTEYPTEASCEQCDEVYSCYEYQAQDCSYVYPNCTYADPDENWQCPAGFTLNFFGQCEQCEPCPPGYTLDPYYGACAQCTPCPEGFVADGYGGCSRTTTVSDCEDCEGYCTYVETIGPCGSFSADCKGDCLYDCCFCDGQCQQRTYLDCLQCGGHPKRIVPIVDAGFGQMLPGPCMAGACSENEDCCNIAPCDEECEWPEQITVEISGMPAGYSYRFQNAGSGFPLPPGTEDDLVYRIVGGGSGIGATFTNSLPKDGSYVLDRVSASCNLVEYAGVAPAWACAQVSGSEGSCEDTQEGIAVRLTRVTCGGTALGFSATFGTGAHAVVTSYDHATGAISGVRVCEGGGGYATGSAGSVQVASVSVTVYSTHGGSGATLDAVIDDDPSSGTFGQITGLVITNGGSGYGIGGWTISGEYGGIGLLAGIDLSPGFAACQIGQELSGFEEPASELLSKEKCGVDLLAKSYSARFSAETFPSAVSAAAGVTYSLGRDPVHNVCDVLEVVGITWSIS